MGQWNDDNKNGRGIFTWPDGNRYERDSSNMTVGTFMGLITKLDMVNVYHL